MNGSVDSACCDVITRTLNELMGSAQLLVLDEFTSEKLTHGVSSTCFIAVASISGMPSARTAWAACLQSILSYAVSSGFIIS